LRSQRIYSIHIENKDSYFVEQQPIDDFVVSISKYYFDKRGKYDINKFKELLGNEDQIEKVIQYFTKELDNFISAHNKELQSYIFMKMDNLIDASITEAQQT
jgi:glutaredoxin 2